MLNLLDELLRQVLMTNVTQLRPVAPGSSPAPVTEQQVGFIRPDDQWHGDVRNMERNALNVYLVDLRENRKLRTNERERKFENGVVYEDPAPMRMDCHYLISAWSPTKELSPQVEPVLDEHILLYQATAVLVNAAPFNPSRVYPSASAPLNAWPARFRNVDLPAVIIPTEGFPKLAEFWGTMGQGHRWKPVVYLVVTIPVELAREIAGPMVTTRITEYRQMGKPETAEVWIQIGGFVLTTAPARRLAIGSTPVRRVQNGTVTVDSTALFRVGDIVTENNTARSTITQIPSRTVLTLNNALSPLTANLRIANLIPSQIRFRLNDTTGVEAGGWALIRGRDANAPGSTVEERVLVEDVNSSTRFVTLQSTPARSKTYKMDVPAAQAPELIPLLPANAAWVGLEDPAGTALQTTETNKEGQFTFNQVKQGTYVLRVRFPGYPEITRTIEIPSPDGNYDVILS